MGIKGFISYAHDDRELFQQFQKGITQHSRLLKDIRWEIWHDGNITVGRKWHEAIQKSIADCAFAILLISPAFFASDYIEEKELRLFLERHGEDDTFLIFPVLVRPYRFENVPELNKIQLFVPDGDKYGQPGKKNLAFSHVIGKPEVDDYFIDCVKALEKSLEKVFAAREQKKTAAVASPSVGNESFDIIPCTELTPKDFFHAGRARSVREHFYWKRPRVDDTIKELLDKKENMVILGNHLSGKTRSFYEAIKNRLGWCLIKPKRGVECCDLVLPTLPDGPKIAFFDDIHGYAGKDSHNLGCVVEKLLEMEIPIVAACRTGPEYMAFRAGMQDLELDFREVVIEKMSVDEERSFLQTAGDCGGDLDKEAFRKDHDKNIGSFFLDITGMRNRYEVLRDKIVPEYKRHNKYSGPARLPETILEGIAYFYYAGRYTAGEGYSIDDIKDFCARKFDYDHRQVGKGPDRSGRGVKSSLSTGLEKLGIAGGDKDKGFINRDFDEALDILSDTARHDLSFIDVQQPWIFMEAVYIEKIVRVRGDVGEIIGNLKKYYKWEEIKSRFLTNVYHFSHFIRSARGLEQGMKVLEQMQELGVTPDVVTFTSLLPLCRELEQAFDIIDKMQVSGIQPNVVTFTSLLPLCRELEQGFDILDKMQSSGIPPNVVTFNSLLHLCRELEQGFDIIDNRMRGFGIQPDVVTFTSLLPLCKELWQGFDIFKKMQSSGTKPDVVAFNSLLPLCKELEQGFAIIDNMRNVGIQFNVVTFNSLLPLCKELKQGFDILDKMQVSGIQPGVVTFNSLLPLCKELKQGFAIIDKMQGAGIQPDVVTFNSLLPLCKELKQGFDIIEKMQAAGIQPDVVTFTSLLPFCKELEQGFDIIEKMQAARIHPDVKAFTSLLRLCRELEQGFDIIDKMERAKIRPNIVTFSSLLKLTRDKAGLDRVESARMKDNIQINDVYNRQLQTLKNRYV